MTARTSRFLCLTILAGILAIGLSLEVLLPHSAGVPGRGAPLPPPDPSVVNKVIDIQNQYTDDWLALPGVIGTGTALDDQGNVVINVYTRGAGNPQLPRTVNGVSVQVVPFTVFHPLAGAGSSNPRQFQSRPVPIGVSANSAHARCGTGTMGARLRGPDGNIYALSTNHVFADENQAPTQTPVLQPSPGDTGCVINASKHTIGNLFDFQNIEFSTTACNRFDAAIISSNDSLIGASTPADGYGAPNTQTVAPVLGQPVQKYGRTTRLTQGTVAAINVTAIVNYLHGPARFVGQIEVTTPRGTPVFATFGDSGALAVDDSSHPVGLVFAGGNRQILLNPIDDILSAYDMTIDDGSLSPPPACVCTGCPSCNTDELNLGYDPNVPEPVMIGPPDVSGPLPPRCTVNLKYVPPVGGPQKTPNCFVWASTYGLATFTAAKQGDYCPSSPNLQASSAYLYIDIMQGDGNVPKNCCTGGSITSCLQKLLSTGPGTGGTPSMLAAPYYPNCCTLWDLYDSQDLTNNTNFSIPGFAAVSAKNPDLNDIKQILHSGRALAYGTHLYTDFGSYNGHPIPYVGNGTIAKYPSGQDVGHCMLIIGYDDTLGTAPNKGAFLIQNSFGPNWGEAGRVWIAYSTFSTLSEGTAFYIQLP